MRICFFGDSFVHGTGDDDALGWVGRVVAKARREGHDVTAYNLGVRRNTSADVLARWKSEASSRLPPEHDGRLVFSFGANDCAQGVARAESIANAEAILDAARRWLPTLMIGPGIIADSPEVTARICELSDDCSIHRFGRARPWPEMARTRIEAGTPSSPTRSRRGPRGARGAKNDA